MRKFIAAILISTAATACTLQKNIEIDLPTYEPKPVVECYLEPNKPYRLTLLETLPFTANPTLPTLNGALVIITHNGVADTLKNVFSGDSLIQKFYNYSSTRLVPADYNTDFTLYIKDQKGRVMTSTCQILPPTPIDSVVLQFGDTPPNDTLALALTYFTDVPNTKNYYRTILNYDGPTGYQERDFVLDDTFANNNKIILGTRRKYHSGDVLYFLLYHIDLAHFNYAQSVLAALQASGSPFGQPGNIISNITGGIGIFTGASYTTKIVEVQ
jgi:hypothetical protein